MKQQLYINGEAVDMPADEIKIKVASNLLADVSKLMTAHSYSVTLPRTMTNDRIFGLAYIPGADTGGKTTHKYLTAALHIDGVPLFADGRAVLNAVDDKGYSLNLYWGLLDVFTLVKEENLKLCDLPLSSRWNEDWGDWYSLLRDNGYYYESGMTQEIYDQLGDDKGDAALYPWMSPVVSMNTIMSKVAQVYGLPFSYSLVTSSRMAALVHPLTTLNVKCSDEVVTGRFVSATRRTAIEYVMDWSTTATVDNTAVFGRLMLPHIDYDINGWYNVVQVSFGTLRIYGTANHNFSAYMTEAWLRNCTVTTGGTPYANTSGDGNMWFIPAVDMGDNTWGIDIVFRNVTLDRSDIRWHYDHQVPMLYMKGDGWPVTSTPVHDVKCDFEITSAGDDWIGSIFNTANYSYVRNYPSLTVMDYLKEFMAHCGACIVGSVTKPGSVRFVTLDEIVAATPVAYDMTGLTSIGMALDDIGAKNTYTHKANDDDGIEYDAEGVIYANDETLTAEKKAFESKFKVPRNNFIKQWDVELATDGEATYTAKWVKAGDYIAGDTYDVQHFTAIANTGQDFATIIENYYSAYKRLIDQPKVIEVTVRLSVLDLMAVDFARPVYINQLAAAFILLEINSDKGDSYKFKLLSIKEAQQNG